MGGVSWSGSAGKEDAAFIAASRTLVPQLCDALEAAQKEINAFEQKYLENEQSFKMLEQKITALTARAEKAEAERDVLKSALSHLEHAVSRERGEHSIGVSAAIHRARELLKGGANDT